MAGVVALLALSAPLHANCVAGQFACCLTTTTYNVQRGPDAYCSFTECSGGYDNEEYQFESECIVCQCGVFESYFPTGGTCYNISPEKQPPSAHATYGAYDPPVSAYVRGCDGNYSLLRIGRAG